MCLENGFPIRPTSPRGGVFPNGIDGPPLGQFFYNGTYNYISGLN